jgi:di/tricarboxylate transporter
MNVEQASLLVLLAAMLVLFSLDRFRIEVVAIGGLLAGFLLKLYPAEAVFSGFASPVVITVVEILLIVQVLAQAKFFDGLAQRFQAAGWPNAAVIATLAGITGFISIFMNNIGAFAIMLPATLRAGAVLQIPRRQLVIPISFAALLGGLVSLIGTPANLLVSDALAKATGTGFRFFDFAYAGLPVAIAGILLISALAVRLFPETEGEVSAPPPATRRIVAEREIPLISRLSGTRLADCPERFGLQPHALIRGGNFVFGSLTQSVITAGDILLAEGADAVFSDLEAEGALVAPLHPNGLQTDFARVEAVVMPESTLIGSRIRALDVFRNRGISVSALSMRSPRIEGRFEDLQLSIGDILVLEGTRDAIAEALEECECLPLATQPATSGVKGSWRPFAIFAAGVALSAFGLLRPEIAFAAVVFVLAVTRFLNIRQAMADINWPIVIMLAAMIPIGSAVAATGTAEVLAHWLSLAVPISMPVAGIALLLFIAMALTPFVNNATVAIVLSPIALEFAAAAHHPPAAYLIVVAAGASLDFLTPFGHHNNTLAMSIGSYRVSDFLRAGGPLALLGYIMTVLIVAAVWL